MKSSEKKLAAVVGGLLLLIGGYYVWSSASDAISLRRNKLAAARTELERQNRTLQRASRATRELANLKQRSLPKSRDQANSVYSEWLLGLVDRLQFRDPSVRAADRRLRSGYFDRLRFDIDAEATLEQLADFLAEFYAVGDLHKIRSLTIEPIPDSRHLDLLISIEAILLPIAERQTVGDLESAEVNPEMIVAARHAIQNRAMFFPLNIAPQLEGVNDQLIVRGRDWRVEARASDADPWDQVSFEIKSDLPEGMRFSERGDRIVLSWRPRENGEYAVELAARDTGSPPRETVQRFTLTVVDPPEQAEEDGGRSRVRGFDHATQTYLVATVARGDRTEAWFNVRTQGDMLKVKVGDRLRVGSIDGEVIAISVAERTVEVKTEYETLNVGVGKPLVTANASSVASRESNRD